MDPKQIKTARESYGLKQHELAVVAGISPSQMSRVEAGKRRLRLDEAEKIAAKLNLVASDITEESRPTPRKSYRSASLPLPEGLAILEYPADLSPQSREELKQWLELIAKIISRRL